jgi:hypothetical protein
MGERVGCGGTRRNLVLRSLKWSAGEIWLAETSAGVPSVGKFLQTVSVVSVSIRERYPFAQPRS